MIKKSKVLITGGAGFIGSNLVEELIKKNLEIIIIDDLSSGHLKNISEFKSKVKFIKADICDHKKISKLMVDVDTVYHLAAMVSVPMSFENPKRCYEVNVISSINLLDECIKNNAKFIFASSAAIYGEDKTEVKSEDLLTIPISPYGQSKLDIESLCAMYHKKYGLNYTCFRNFNVYGPKQDISSSYAAAIPTFITKALKNENLVIYGDGTQTRDFIYVKDVVSAYILAMENKSINGVFNLGCNEVISIKDLSSKIILMCDSSSKINYEKERIGDIKHSRSNSTKYERISNWKPKFSLEKGIKETVSYYRYN